MFKIIQKRKIWYALSLLVLIPGIVSLIFWGLNPGIDFTGGSLLEYKFSARPEISAIESAVSPIDLGKLSIAWTGADSATIKLRPIDQETVDKITKVIQEKYPDAEILNFESIGPTIGSELKQKSFLMSALVLLGILLYVTYVFRGVSKRSSVSSWVFGGVTIVALFHDSLIVLGAASILGHFFSFEVDTLFVTALLTVIGFSVHDTIVVFDRIRERLRVSAEHLFETTINESVNQTMIRSVNTSATVLIVLAALFLFGGESLRDFVLVLLIGIFAGTYSSIFIASPLLVTWEKIKSRTQ